MYVDDPFHRDRGVSRDSVGDGFDDCDVPDVGTCARHSSACTSGDWHCHSSCRFASAPGRTFRNDVRHSVRPENVKERACHHRDCGHCSQVIRFVLCDEDVLVDYAGSKTAAGSVAAVARCRPHSADKNCPPSVQ